MQPEKMTVTLRALPREEKLILAKIYQQMAEDLLDQVKEADATKDLWKRQGKRVDVRHGIPDAMIAELQIVHSEDDAIQIVAAKLQTTPSAVAYNWKAYKKEQERELRLLRDREILKMARAGKSNAEIARRYGISRPYVSKIVKRDFRKLARYGDH